MSKEKEERITKTVTDTGEPDTITSSVADDKDIAWLYMLNHLLDEQIRKENADAWLGPFREWPVRIALVCGLIAAVCLAALTVVDRGQRTPSVERCSGAVARLEKPAGGAAVRAARYLAPAAVSSDQI